MKIKPWILLTALSVIPSMANADDAFDAQGYREMYLRGVCSGQWGVNQDFKFTREGDNYTLHLESLDGPFKISGTEWQLNWGADDESLMQVSSPTVQNARLDGHNWQASGLRDVTISFTLPAGAQAADFQYNTVTFSMAETPLTAHSGTLPVLYIEVRDENGAFNNEVIDYNLSHKDYFTATYRLDAGGCDWMAGAADLGSEEEMLPCEIKARGNWTRIGYSKKPFKLKLAKKQSMLGLSNSKHFALLAHADDTHGYLRNFTGFTLAQEIGLPWTPSVRPVEVYINRDYRGLYFLTESIRVESDRVDIAELEDGTEDGALISGGYIVELDNYDEPEESQIQMDEKGRWPGYKDKLRITFDTPEVYSPMMRRFVTEQFSAMNDLLGEDDDNLWSYLDLDDAVRYYLVTELISHYEAFHGSTYLFRDRGEGQKWHFSPMWDCGNAFRGPENDFYYNSAPYGNTWVPSFRLNAKFNACLAETWKWFASSHFDNIYSRIDDFASRLGAAAQADYRRWHDVPTPPGGSGIADNRDMAACVNTVKSHLANKFAWLAEQWGAVPATACPEPSRDDTPAAPLPEYAQAGVENVDVEASAPVEYYTLTSLRVGRPTRGNIYIRRQGPRADKVIF